MAKAFREQMDTPDSGALTFEERLGLMADREATEREATERDDRRLTLRLNQARLREQACMEDIDYRHHTRLTALLNELATGRGDGRYARLMRGVCRVDLLILDDFGLVPLSSENRRDLFEAVEERYERKSTIITSQLPVENWHAAIGDPTIADAILDRVVHNAYKITMKGESMRKSRSKLTKSGS